MKTQSLTRKCCPRAHFFGGSDARIIVSGEEALIRPRHAQDAQMKSQRSFGVITGDCDTLVLTPPNRRRRRLRACGLFGASTRELATDNGRPPQI